ncbi:MAG: hypothetical protein ACI9LV_000911 [Candidatus Nanohaloarchaea archaeon]|jgi:hypothetical protein
MGVVTEHYLESFAEKSRDFNSIWNQSPVKDALERTYSFDYPEGELVEIEGSDETYEITGRKPVYSVIFDEDVYTADRLWEDHDGNLQRAHDEKTIRGDKIQ